MNSWSIQSDRKVCIFFPFEPVIKTIKSLYYVLFSHHPQVLNSQPFSFILNKIRNKGIHVLNKIFNWGLIDNRIVIILIYHILKKERKKDEYLLKSPIFWMIGDMLEKFWETSSYIYSIELKIMITVFRVYKILYFLESLYFFPYFLIDTFFIAYLLEVVENLLKLFPVNFILWLSTFPPSISFLFLCL